MIIIMELLYSYNNIIESKYGGVHVHMCDTHSTVTAADSYARIIHHSFLAITV